MRLGNKTIEKLVAMINEEFVYRSGPMLVALFNQLGANDRYGQGFPSRATYTRNNIDRLNGTAGIDECLKMVFSPSEFLECPEKLNPCIESFNRYLAFDGWRVIIINNEVSFERVNKASIVFPKDKPQSPVLSEIDLFLKQEFAEVDFNFITDAALEDVLRTRLAELKNCLKHDIPFAAVIHSGGILETILLEIATAHTREFTSAKSAPRNQDGTVVQIFKWKLSGLIEVSKELGYIKEDVYKFCQHLRDFRNYIHPRQQLTCHFTPDLNTAKICWHVLKGAVAQIKQRLKVSPTQNAAV